MDVVGREPDRYQRQSGHQPCGGHAQRDAGGDHAAILSKPPTFGHSGGGRFQSGERPLGGGGIDWTPSLGLVG
jgi:hypothetical protein